METEPKTYIASGGECLCEVATKHGYADCQVLRNANPALAESEVLEPGAEVTIPAKTLKEETGATEQLHRFEKKVNELPTLEFIREDGKGYGVNVPKSSGTGSSAREAFDEVNASPEPRPELDRKLSELAISNYVCDRGGDGTLVGNFPAEDFFGHDELGSQDPDHFKVQVKDPEAKGAAEIKLTMFAMKPDYFEAQEQGQRLAVRHPKRFVRPANVQRTLEVTCKRIEGTDYFRSPYLRLVTTEASKLRRPRQLLMTSDYWDEGGKVYEKHYTEILHQRVESDYKVIFCPVKKCKRLEDVGLDRGLSLHIAFWILQGTMVTKDQIREQMYKWTRRALAPAHIRPVVEQIKEVAEPKNMLIVADEITATSGRHASGKNAAGQPSEMRFTIDGVTLTHKPAAGDSPLTTATKIQALIGNTAGLAGYSTQRFEQKRGNLAAGANQISNPFDILVFRPAGPDGEPVLAEVTAATSSDAPQAGVGGQSLSRVTDFVLDNFPVEFEPISGRASAPQRILRWNFSLQGCINCYVLGAQLIHRTGSPPGPLDGWAPLGPFAGFAASVGPCVYLSRTGAANRAFVPVHEMGHPLMHAIHTRSPRRDSAVGLPPPAANEPDHPTVEFMDAGLVEDAHDATKHIADAPIAAEYFLQEDLQFVRVDGRTPGPAPRGTTTTPVRRLVQVGATYGIIRNEADPPVDPEVTDLPPGMN